MHTARPALPRVGATAREGCVQSADCTHRCYGRGPRPGSLGRFLPFVLAPLASVALTGSRVCVHPADNAPMLTTTENLGCYYPGGKEGPGLGKRTQDGKAKKANSQRKRIVSIWAKRPEAGMQWMGEELRWGRAHPSGRLVSAADPDLRSSQSLWGHIQYPVSQAWLAASGWGRG